MKRVDKLTAGSGGLKSGKRVSLNRQLLVSGRTGGVDDVLGVKLITVCLRNERCCGAGSVKSEMVCDEYSEVR